MLFTICITLLLFLNLCCGESIVNTKFGDIAGTETYDQNGNLVYRFLGIPYAVPPVKELRFREPQPWIAKFGQPWQASVTVQCLQNKSPTDRQVIGQEDCLYLNVYTTTLDRKAKHDVVVFIHGGAFLYGAGYHQTPDYLFSANKQLVFVSINYRLGPFGFLSTEDNVAPGNNGLKDQVVALKWVRDNIDRFGGNPDKVILAGTSAGAVSVHLHYMSRQSRNLFAYGISMSGAALSPLVKTTNIRKETEDFARLFDCPTTNSLLMVKCLRLVSGNKIIEKLSTVKPEWNQFYPYMSFGPVIEKTGLENTFIDEHPFYILQKGKVKYAPWLASMTTAEGLAFADFFVDDENALKKLDDNWNLIVPWMLQFNDLTPSEELIEINKKIKHEYLNDEPITKQNRDQLVQLIGDRHFKINIENAVRLHAAATKAPVYFYVFDYQGKYSLSPVPGHKGASHQDDLIYILRMADLLPQTEDGDMVNKMVGVWTSFIKNKKPDAGNGVEWPQVARNVVLKGNLDYMSISSQIGLESSDDLSHREFWENLPLIELHVSGNQFVPKHIKALRKGCWILRYFFYPLANAISRLTLGIFTCSPFYLLYKLFRHN